MLSENVAEVGFAFHYVKVDEMKTIEHWGSCN